ncbi:hypothetical protein GCM10027615_74940 [Plantactinospora veratri]
MGRKKTVTGLVGLVVTVALGATGIVGLRALHRLAEPPGRPVCSAAEAAFAATFATDPMLTRAPAGMELDSTEYAEPCESVGVGDWHGGAVTIWAYPAAAGPARQEIERFYRDLAQRRGWPAGGDDAPAGPWFKSIDGRRVEFRLSPDHRRDGRTVLRVSMTYRIEPRDGAVRGTGRVVE